MTQFAAHPGAAALGIASIPFGARNAGGLSFRAACRRIEAAVLGAESR